MWSDKWELHWPGNFCLVTVLKCLNHCAWDWIRKFSLRAAFRKDASPLQLIGDHGDFYLCKFILHSLYIPVYQIQQYFGEQVTSIPTPLYTFSLFSLRLHFILDSCSTLSDGLLFHLDLALLLSFGKFSIPTTGRCPSFFSCLQSSFGAFISAHTGVDKRTNTELNLELWTTNST